MKMPAKFALAILLGALLPLAAAAQTRGAVLQGPHGDA